MAPVPINGFTYLVISPACNVARVNENAHTLKSNFFMVRGVFIRYVSYVYGFLFCCYFNEPAVELLCCEKIQPDVHQIFSGENLVVTLQ